MTSCSKAAGQENDVVYKALTHLIKIILDDSKHHATMAKRAKTEINKSLLKCIPKFVKRQNDISNTYNTEMTELKVKMAPFNHSKRHETLLMSH